MLTPSSRIRVNRQGNCPYCGSTDLELVQVLRPDRTAAQCGGCDGYSIRHSNGFQYPLEDRMDLTTAPAVTYLE